MLVISAKSGQLGNRLLLSANFMAYAIENNFTVLNPAFEEYAEFFQSTARDILCRYPTATFSIPGNSFLRKYYYNINRYLAESRRFNTLEIKRNKPFNWSNSSVVNEIKPGAINFFQGWMFRGGWFVDDIPNLRKNGKKIRAYFQPLRKYQLNIEKLILKIRSQADTIIGIHIRHGDYQQHQNGIFFYSPEEYLKVMESAKALFPNKKVTFLICSNQIQDKHYFQHLSYVYGNNHIIEDMYSLAECDYIIGPPSSYTMWASFYGERPLYMIRDINKALRIQDFVHFYEWQGVFHYNEDWSKSVWEWTH
ncbi:alpha-1,2-fucosyltransferase [aff. Roholtiella sp. LEGE 12411]|uniref:alpha-1,2-fucosyltransferase n=1 Tax=aff. Roholtiella sp. LEGE 12411 TaxID=1828822 RepID=UPI0018813625|nr:alpha-1,2-fucosyltransferase [aff. Roholtiella sp. LEGE 12411]MBE9034965.1 alpha-1,2-fucosyltransferase [aff. Roholtiella sp. LEGE 12411]